MKKSTGNYYTPKHIVDFVTGTGGFLKKAADDLQNPPYKARCICADGLFAVNPDGKCAGCGLDKAAK